MYNTDPTPEEFDRALQIAREVLEATTAGQQLLSEGRIREWTSKVLDTCYAIGCDYGVHCVSEVAKALAGRL